MQDTIHYLIINIGITVCGLTCEEYLEIPPEKKISKADLESMSPQDVTQCVLQLGRDRLPLPDAEFVWKSIIKYHEGIANIPDEILGNLHWITIAITPEDYANMTLGNIDVVQNFGLNYNLNEEQLSALATRVLEDFASKEPEDYTFYDLTAIRQILCAFNRTVISRIHASSYREASLLIGKLENCNPEVMSAFAALATQDLAFGPLEGWTEDTVNIVGKVADYLPKEFLAKFSARTKPTSRKH